MAMDIDVNDVPICSGSMSHTYNPRKAERFSASSSCRSVPLSSAQAFRHRKTFSAALERTGSTRVCYKTPSAYRRPLTSHVTALCRC